MTGRRGTWEAGGGEVKGRRGERGPDVALEPWYEVVLRILVFLELSGFFKSGFSLCGNPPGSWPVHAVTL